jgi:hypothetical protein
MLKTKALILAKIESVYGTDPLPVPATDAILCESPEIEVIEKKLERKNVKSYFGSNPIVAIGEGLKIKTRTELKGSGTAGIAPEIDPLLLACNFTASTVASTSNTYAPNSKTTDAQSVTIYFYLDGLLHKIVGARGTFDIDLKAGEYGGISWEFTGIYAGPTDTTMATGVAFDATVPPRFVSASFAIDSYAAIIESMKVKIANEIVRRPSANAATGILEYFCKDRKITGDIDPEAVLLATKDFWTMWSGNSQVALTATVGSVAGNRCVISGAQVQLDGLKYGDRENILTYALPLVFMPSSAGDDDISLAFT